jgi:hypothetical protein
MLTSNAQVYSQNIVGYSTVSLSQGFTMVANQLDVDGTGHNNSIATVLGTNLPNGLIVEAWNGTSFGSTKWSASAGKWSASSLLITNAMQPGVGFFVSSPVATNITEVGNVLQGTNVLTITPGFQVVSETAPVAGGIASTFGYTPTKGDVVEVWAGSGFVSHKWSGSVWSGGGEPQLSVGESVFLNSASTGSTNWVQNFTVQ